MRSLFINFFYSFLRARPFVSFRGRFHKKENDGHSQVLKRSVFVERSSTKERTRQPPLKFGNKCFTVPVCSISYFFTILSLSSFAQPQSKCLLLFFFIQRLKSKLGVDIFDQ
jgi:hypothetical protein